MALGVGVMPRAWIEEMQRGVTEFRRTFEAHADTGTAEFEVQAAGRADVGVELVTAGFGEHPRFLAGVERFHIFGQHFRFGCLERPSVGPGGLTADRPREDAADAFPRSF